MERLPVTSPAPNSRAMFEQIERALADDRERGRRTGVVVIELDERPTDPVMRELMVRLDTAGRDDDLVGRLSPRRLVLLAPRLREVDALAQLVVRITAALRSPVEVHGSTYECPLTVSGAISDARSTAWSLVDAAIPRTDRERAFRASA